MVSLRVSWARNFQWKDFLFATFATTEVIRSFPDFTSRGKKNHSSPLIDECKPSLFGKADDTFTEKLKLFLDLLHEETRVRVLCFILSFFLFRYPKWDLFSLVKFHTLPILNQIHSCFVINTAIWLETLNTICSVIK